MSTRAPRGHVMVDPTGHLRRLLRQFGNGVATFLPDRYTTPTSGYLFEKLLKDLSSRVFMTVDRVGIHALPKHFYTPIPDYAWLRANREYWDSSAPLTDILWDLDAQLDWISGLCRPYLPEVLGLESLRTLELSGFGPGYGPIDAQILHCFMRSHRPGRVIEIGSGMSTAIMVEADVRNQDDGVAPTRFTAIDPFPRPALALLEPVQLIRDHVQRVPLELFNSLSAGDLLFIDSSHAVKIGSDVVHLFLRVIPKLHPGVIVHVHDISLPYLYPRTALEDYFGWQETVILAALLTGNRSLTPLASLSALHYDRADQLRLLLPDYQPQSNDAGMRAGEWVHRHLPDSFWMETSG